MKTIKVYTIKTNNECQAGKWYVPERLLRDTKIALRLNGNKLGEVAGPFEIDKDFLNNEHDGHEMDVEGVTVNWWDDVCEIG